jgi:hypothetical protein
VHPGTSNLAEEGKGRGEGRGGVAGCWVRAGGGGKGVENLKFEPE